MSAKDQPFRMWPYYRDTKGTEIAAGVYFPNSFRNDPSLYNALMMVEHGKALIEKRMAELAELEPDDDQEN